MTAEKDKPRFCALPLERRVRGWIVDGTLVHPLEAYRDSDDWLASFEALFPERKKKMRAYSERQGWREPAHRMAWKQVLIPWLNRVSPNSHFFTASESECAGLKSMQAVPAPADTQQWNFEGNGFYSVMPVQDAQGQMRCMGGTAPVYRAYNNAYPASGGKNPWDSNHRYSTQIADIDEMASKGWVPEGIAFCAPVAAQ